jgi:hypothetical protein
VPAVGWDLQFTLSVSHVREIMNTYKYIKRETQEETNRIGEQERASRLAQYNKKKAKKK